MRFEHVVLAGGLDFAEGPVWLGPGDVAFVELRSQRVRRYRNGSVSTVATLPGAPNGAALDEHGVLFVTNNGGVAPRDRKSLWRSAEEIGGCVQRVTLDGRVSQLTSHLPGPEPVRLNDICRAPGGGWFVTDSHNWEVLTRDRRRLKAGSIYFIDDRGESRLVARVAGFPNGIAVSPRMDRLFVTLSVRRRIVTLPLNGHEAGRPELFATIPGGGPDGIAFDDQGNLYVAASVARTGGDAVYVFSAQGRPLRTFALPPGSDPTNICIGDGGLYVTLGLGGQLIFLPHDVRAASSPSGP